MMAHQMRHDPDAIFIFANTGKEMPETLDFVRDCAEHWGVKIIWLEYRSRYSYAVVDYETASRDGYSFKQLIIDKWYLPNMMARFCTSELKVLTIERYLKDKGITEWETAVGIRADEPRRVAKMRQKEGYLTPLADAKIIKQDVINFWRQQDFDLKLPESGYYSNCDLCFLKGYGIKQSLVNENPELAEWWADQEEMIEARFRSDQPSYAQMIASTASQDDLFGYDDSIACFCGD
jgi:3'-phosphoadenosine 5'-phosphosulfate sulfotransferase (PAPS reductase)/FAD synthetase